MITKDERLDRQVREQIATTTTYTERDLNSYTYIPGDRDYEIIENEIGRVIEQLREDMNTRRAIVMTDEKACIVGVQVLVRDHVHVLAWLRSSDVKEYRPGDIGFLKHYGEQVRDALGLDSPLRVHVFTSSLHEEI